jgi:hypothetical protein
MRFSKIPPWPVAAAGAAIASLSILAGRLRKRSPGSPTSASDAVDDVELRPDATPDEVVDVGVKHTFPASDPPAIEEAFETAFQREQRLKRLGAQQDASATAAPAHRSPDWMLRKR